MPRPQSNGLSMNNIQLIVPVLQSDLRSIIYVLINPNHRALQRILWRDHPSDTLASKVLQGGCFREWCSNSSEILKGIDSSDLTYGGLDFSNDDKTKTLGLTWSCQSGKLFYSINSDPVQN